MNTKIYTLVVTSALLAVCAPAQTLPKASASPSGPATMPGSQTTTAPSPSPASQGERAIPFHGKIASVDAKAKTFTVAGKEKSRTFKITDKTAVTKNGQPATISDVTANEDARGSYWKMPDGSMEVKTLKLGPAAEQTKAKANDKKEKPTPSPASSASPSTSPH